MRGKFCENAAQFSRPSRAVVTLRTSSHGHCTVPSTNCVFYALGDIGTSPLYGARASAFMPCICSFCCLVCLVPSWSQPGPCNLHVPPQTCGVCSLGVRRAAVFSSTFSNSPSIEDVLGATCLIFCAPFAPTLSRCVSYEAVND